jgi:hypothetical protein
VRLPGFVRKVAKNILWGSAVPPNSKNLVLIGLTAVMKMLILLQMGIRYCLSLRAYVQMRPDLGPGLLYCSHNIQDTAAISPFIVVHDGDAHLPLVAHQQMFHENYG